MTDEELREKYKDVPTSQMIRRIFVLLGKLVLLILKHILVMILRGIVRCYRECKKGVIAFRDFWNSDDTQDKKRSFIASTKKNLNKLKLCAVTLGSLAWKYSVIGAKAFWKYTCIGCRLLAKYTILLILGIWHGILWTLTTIKDLIIHSKPTFIRLGKAIKKGAIDFWHWMKRARRGMKLSHIRRVRAWKRFRREKGFKGLLIDIGRGLSNGIQAYMNEDSNDDSVAETNKDNIITEDDIIAEEIEDNQSKANQIGKKIFLGVKDIIEEK